MHHDNSFRSLDSLDVEEGSYRSPTDRLRQLNRQKPRRSQGGRSSLSWLTTIGPYIVQDIKKHPMQIVIASCSVFLVVTFVSILLTVFSVINPLFLSINETNLGNTDFMLLRPQSQQSVDPKTVLSSVLVDVEEIQESIKGLKDQISVAPRWFFPASVGFQNLSFKSFAIVGNASLEAEIGLGRSVEAPLPEYGEIYISQELAESLNAKKGDQISIVVDWISILKERTNQMDRNNTEVAQGICYLISQAVLDYTEFKAPKIDPEQVARPIVVNVTIAAVLDNPGGKWPSVLGAVVYLDTITVAGNMAERIANASQFPEDIDPDVFMVSFTNSVDVVLNSYAMTANFVYKEKLRVYSNFRTFSRKSNLLKNIVMERIADPLKYQILDLNGDTFQQLGLLATFISNIMFSIIFMFAIVAYFVIAAVTSLAVEQKNHTFNIIRSIGAPRSFVVLTVVFETGVYAVMGTLGAMVVNKVFTLFANGYFRSLTHLPVSLVLPSTLAVVLAGVILPLIASFIALKVPAQLSSSGISTSGAGTVTVKYSRLADLAPFTNIQFFLGLELFIFGLSAYYFAPLAFLNNRVDLFLLLLTSLFMGAVAGAIVLAETVRRQCLMVTVRLIAHVKKWYWLPKMVDDGSRKGQSSGMQSVWIVVSFVVCFVIFTGAGITAQIKLVSDQITMLQGADIVVQKSGSATYLREKEMRQVLQSDSYKNDVVANASFVSLNLRDKGFYSQFVPWGLSGIYSNLYGVEDNLLYTIESQLYQPDAALDDSATKREILPTGQANHLKLLGGNLSQALYKIDPYLLHSDGISRNIVQIPIPVMQPTGVKYSLNTKVGDKALLYAPNMYDMEVKLVHQAKKLPGFRFSGYHTTMKGEMSSDTLTGMAYVEYILDCIRSGYRHILPGTNKSLIPPSTFDNWITLNSTRRVPKSKLFIKLHANATSRSRSMLKSELRLLLSQEDIILDRMSTQKAMDSLVVLLRVLNIIICSLFAVLALFLMVIGTTRRLALSALEIGTLRSIGLEGKDVAEIFKAEIVSGLASSIFTGTCLGLLISAVGAGALSVFFELQPRLSLPWVEFLSLLTLLTASAYLTTRLTLHKVTKTQIVKLLKGKI